MQLFTIYDIKSERFAPPTAAVTTAAFLRDIASTLANPPQHPSPFHDHPEDFQLWEIGVFDLDKGVVSPLDKPNHLGLASDYLPRAAASTAA